MLAGFYFPGWVKPAKKKGPVSRLVPRKRKGGVVGTPAPRKKGRATAAKKKKPVSHLVPKKRKGGVVGTPGKKGRATAVTKKKQQRVKKKKQKNHNK